MLTGICQSKVHIRPTIRSTGHESHPGNRLRTCRAISQIGWQTAEFQAHFFVVWQSAEGISTGAVGGRGCDSSACRVVGCYSDIGDSRFFVTTRAIRVEIAIRDARDYTGRLGRGVGINTDCRAKQQPQGRQHQDIGHQAMFHREFSYSPGRIINTGSILSITARTQK